MRSAHVAAILLLGVCVGCSSNGLQDTGKLLQLDQEQILFGEVVLGTSVSTDLRLTNLGRSPMNLAALEVPVGFEISPSSFTLAAGTSTRIEVSFRPTAAQLYQGTIRFDSTSGEGSVLHVEGRGLGLVLETPASVDFGLVPVGDGRSLEVSVLNLIDRELEVFLEITGSEEFSTWRETLLLGASERVMVPVAFRPLEASGRNARLRVWSCEGCQVHSVSLFGQGVEKEVTLHPAWLEFGQVAVGLAKTLSFEVRNSGIVPLTLALPEPESAAFQFASDRGLHLEVGESTNIQVTFAPTQHGIIEETVDWEDASGWPLGGIFLRGEAVASSAAVPTRLIFMQPAGVTLSQEVEVVSLDPNREVQIIAYSLEGAGANAFEVEGPPFGSAVGQRGQRFTVRYQAEAGVRHEVELLIRTNDLTSTTVRVPILGEEFVGRCELRQSHDEMNFGILPFDGHLSRMLELTNVGSEPCFVWDLRIQECGPCDEDYFQIVEPDPYKIIEVGEIYPVLVEALPKDDSTARRTLQYRYANVFEPASEVPLTYTATHRDARIFEIDPAYPTVFPDTPLGARSVRSLQIRSTYEGAFGLIQSIALGADSSPAFQLSPTNPTMPAAFGREGLSFDVVFDPLVVDRVYGQVVIELKGTNFDERLRFDLVGTGVVTSPAGAALQGEWR